MAAAARPRVGPRTKAASRLRPLVAHAVDGEEILRAARIQLQLPPDVLDVGIDGALVRLKGNPVEGVEELAPSEDAPRGAGQSHEQLELRRGEFHQPSAHAGAHAA